MYQKLILIGFTFTLLSSCTIGQKKEKQHIMENTSVQDSLILEILNEKEDLSNRIEAIQKLSTIKTSTILNDIKKLFKRARPAPVDIENWDPVAAERVIDLYLIKVLNQLGDTTEIYRIGILISQAGRILQGPDDELKNAAKVIQSIGRKEPIDQVIQLTSENNPAIVRNAVLVLNLLNIPDPPIGGNTDSILPNDKYTFQFSKLRQEIEMLVDFSKSKIQLSGGVKEFIKVNDFDRGNVKLADRTLQERVEQDLRMLDFDYFLENHKVIICTHQEAGKRWRDWWLKYHDSFKFK